MINSKKIYYPHILEQIKLKFIPDKNIFQPYNGLDFYYQINELKKTDYFYISANTQLSEFLNKFNESNILPKLGKIKYKEIVLNKNWNFDIENMINDYGWNWINWNSDKGKKVILELNQFKKNLLLSQDFFSLQTIKILGRIRLQESIDYGKNTETAINNYLTNDYIDPNYQWEIEQFIKILNERDLVVIGFSKRIIHIDGIFTGIIDYILMSRKTKKIILSDLKTSSSADEIDYWRQLLFYHKIFISVNERLKNIISDDLIIIHINKDKNLMTSYMKNFKNSNLSKLLNQIFYIKQNYLQMLTQKKDI